MSESLRQTRKSVGRRLPSSTVEKERARPQRKDDEIVAIISAEGMTGGKGRSPLTVSMASPAFRIVAGMPKEVCCPCDLSEAAHISESAHRIVHEAMLTCTETGRDIQRPLPLTFVVDEEMWVARPWAVLTPMTRSTERPTAALRLDQRISYGNGETFRQKTHQALRDENDNPIGDRNARLQRNLRTLSAAYVSFYWETDRYGRLVFVGDKVSQILGYRPEELLGRVATDLLHPDEAERIRKTVNRHPRATLGMPVDFEQIFTTGDGRDIWLRTVMIPIHHPITGRRLGHQGLTIDITERKVEKSALDATLARHKALFESAHDAIIILDAKTVSILDANHQAAQLLAAEKGRLIGCDLKAFLSADASDRVESLVERCKESDDFADDEVMILTAAGRSVPASIRATSVNINDTQIVQVILRTLEDKLSYERQLRRERYAAQAADRSKTEFLANMSHELRTPLNAIIGFSEILEQEMFGKLTEKQKDYISDILDSGRHLLEIINSILDLSKIEVGKFELSEQVIDFTRVAEKSAALVRERAVAGGVSLTRSIEPNIPYLKADPVRFTQILLNLLSNAVKFTQRGGHVTLAAGIDTDSGDLLVSVNDTGIGMSQDELVRAAQPFTQVHGARNRHYEGTGLGLSLAQRLCEQHGATLTLNSTPSIGTEAIIRLPSDRLISVETMTSP